MYVKHVLVQRTVFSVHFVRRTSGGDIVLLNDNTMVIDEGGQEHVQPLVYQALSFLLEAILQQPFPGKHVLRRPSVGVANESRSVNECEAEEETGHLLPLSIRFV